MTALGCFQSKLTCRVRSCYRVSVKTFMGRSVFRPGCHLKQVLRNILGKFEGGLAINSRMKRGLEQYSDLFIWGCAVQNLRGAKIF